MTTHFLYFSNHTKGQTAALELRRRGFDVEDRLGADDLNWLVLVTCRGTPEVDEEFFESIAAEFDGEYDGWEADA